jgi:hypothetical protein
MRYRFNDFNLKKQLLSSFVACEHVRLLSRQAERGGEAFVAVHV